MLSRGRLEHELSRRVWAWAGLSNLLEMLSNHALSVPLTHQEGVRGETI